MKRPFSISGNEGKYDVIALVNGGGTTGQAGALRHGISRALCQADPENRPSLKAAGFLTRDPRMKERKKYGLKKARKSFPVLQEIIAKQIQNRLQTPKSTGFRGFLVCISSYMQLKSIVISVLYRYRPVKQIYQYGCVLAPRRKRYIGD